MEYVDKKKEEEELKQRNDSTVVNTTVDDILADKSNPRLNKMRQQQEARRKAKETSDNVNSKEYNNSLQQNPENNMGDTPAPGVEEKDKNQDTATNTNTDTTSETPQGSNENKSAESKVETKNAPKDKALAEDKAKETSDEGKEQATEELEAEDSDAKQEDTAKKGGGGGGPRLTDMIEPSLDGSTERIETLNASVEEKTMQHLENGAGEKLQAGVKKISKLSKNEQEKETPEQKRKHTENAVEEKKADKEAEKKSQKVQEVSELPKPEAKKEDAKNKLMSSIQDNMPQTIEDVDNFKKNGIANLIGKEVKNTVESKTTEISGNFKQIEKTEKPADPKKAVPLAEIEKAIPTPEMSLGTGLVPKVKDETLDLTTYKDESDNLLKREGIKQEHLDMVDSGDLAEAKTLLDEVKTKSDTEPNALRKEEQTEHKQIEKDLSYHESLSKEKMEKERTGQLNESKKTMGGGVSSMEAKRKEVTDHIQGIYESTNKKVQEKLDALKNEAFAAFDREEKAASAAFAENVKVRMDKFKDERYDGPISGTYNKVRDWLLGLDELPEVKKIFDEERNAYIARLDSAIATIMSQSQKTIDECKTLVSDARTRIDEYVKGLGPELQKIGQEAQADIKKKLDELDEKVNKAAEELKKELEEKKAKAIEALDKKIEEMKEELKGMVDKVGDLLIDAAMKFFKWALEAAGYSADQIMPIIDKGKATITAIVSDPMQFFSNLGSAVGQGIGGFADNIKEHMGEGFMTWMTGKMNSMPIQLPDKFDLKGIVSVVLQVLGLGWGILRSKLATKVGEENVSRLETGAEAGLEVVAQVKEKGPVAMWDMVSERAEEIKTGVVEGGKEWAAIELVKQAVIRIATMLNPAGAIVQAILAIFNTVMFFVNNWDQVTAFVSSVFDSIGAIASGAIGSAAKFVEKSMAMTIPLILDFMAQMLNLGGLADRIQKIIERVRKPIDQILDKIINWITKKFKQVFGKDKKKKGDGDKIKDKKEKPEELDQDDKNEHQKIGRKIEKELKDSKPGKLSLKDYYKKKVQQAKDLEDEYQPKLKKGINLNITVEPFDKVASDDSIKIGISIKPNNYVTTFDLDAPENEEIFARILHKALRAIGGETVEGPTSKDLHESDRTVKNGDTSQDAIDKEKRDLDAERKKKEEELKERSNEIHNRISKARLLYTSAAKAKFFPNNTFSVGGGNFFVETETNFYISLVSLVGNNYHYKLGGSTIQGIFENEAANLLKVGQSSSPLQKEKDKLVSLEAQLEKNAKAGKNTSGIEELIKKTKIKIGETPAGIDAKFQEKIDEINTCIETLKGGPTEQLNAIRFISSRSKDFTTFKDYAGKDVKIGYNEAADLKYGTLSLSVDVAKNLYKDFPANIGNDTNSTIFLANLFAEPTRYSVAHITNMLLLNEKSTLSDSSTPPKHIEVNEDKNTPKTGVFNHTSMTHRGSDPSGEITKQFPKDNRLGDESKANINVTNRDLASVKHNPELLSSLKAIFESHPNKSDEKAIQNEFEAKIKAYLKL